MESANVLESTSVSMSANVSIESTTMSQEMETKKEKDKGIRKRTSEEMLMNDHPAGSLRYPMSEEYQSPQSKDDTELELESSDTTDSSSESIEDATNSKDKDQVGMKVLDKVQTEPKDVDMRLGYIGNVLHQRCEVPEADDLLEVIGQIDGYDAKILLDTGCSTYVLSTDFARENGIQGFKMDNVRTIDLAVKNIKKVQLEEKTRTTRIQIGNTVLEKTMYILPLPNHNAIVGMPFFLENHVSLKWLREGIVEINGIGLRLEGTKWNSNEENETTTPQNSTISRKGLKRAVRCNEVDGLFLATARIKEPMSATPTVEITAAKEKPPDWIKKEYGNIFLQGLPAKMPPVRTVDHQIPLKPNLLPPFKGIFRLSQFELQELKKQLDHLLETGKISPSTSPYGAPVLFVKKKDGSLRMCIDYRALNSQTIQNRYAIPRIDELLDRLYNAKIFSKLDLTSGYHQIRIHSADRPKTAFRTRYGHYEWNVMPFGLTNAPATFQTLMNEIYRDLLDECVIVYLDDILVYSQTPEEHERHLRMVMDRLKENELYAKWSKCDFFVTEIEYLGHIVGPDGIKPNLKLVQAIQEFPQPKSLKELQSFLGLANFYRKFIKNFSEIAAPLTDGTKNASQTRPIIWNEAMSFAFDALKNALVSAPCLALPDPDGEFEVITDASEDAKAVGAVLMQSGHPIAFESAKLNPHQLNYSVHDKEMFAIIHALRKWRAFLLGKHFKCYTDHRSLVYFKTQNNLNQRQLRWQEQVADYDMEILYKPGKENVVADALSRIQISILCPLPTNSLENEVKAGYKNSAFDNLIKEVENNSEPTKRYALKDNLLYYRADEFSPWRLCLPDIPYRNTVIHDNHDLSVAGHPGYTKTYQRIARNYYWPKMGLDIKRHVQQCDECQRTKTSNQPPAGQLQPLPIPPRAWDSIGMDFLGPLPRSKSGHDMILVVIDRLTKMARFIPTKTTVKSKQVAELFMQEVFRHHGLPSTIVSDRDPKFTAKFWQALQKALGIELLMSTADHPQTDGQAEAAVKVIQKLLRPFVFQDLDWEELLPTLEFAYNDTPQSTTGQTPFYLNYGYHPTAVTRHEHVNNPHAEDQIQYILRLQEAARDAINDAQQVQRRYADKHRSVPNIIKVGDWVLLKRKENEKRKLGPIADGPFQVKKVGTNTVKLKFPSKSRAHPTVNISRVQLYFGPRPQVITEPPREEGDEWVEIDEILAHKKEHGIDYYYVHWKGFPSEDNTWEAKEDIGSDALWNLWISKLKQQRSLPH